ncbi:hypothetical protein [Lagierella massiliensis]|uniref:hypothetical protein n=1 Tax=Lagierella massiliensis TaxID=1689303 RepID=UPI0006D77C9C|nr:hypothetical protein [Lagierella massiliensis]
MKYSYELKKECVESESCREGKWPYTPEEVHGPEILKHGNHINWTPDEKLEIVSKVIAGKSIKSTAIENEINERLKNCI